MEVFEQRVLERMASSEEERASLGRVWNQVERAGGKIPDDVLRSVQQRLPARYQRAWTYLPKAVAAVLILGAALGTAIVWPRGVRVYAAGNDGLQVTLSDDSRVEMRAHAEMTVGRASDGIQIDLKTGDIIVTAARQRDGHLSVRTKDMTSPSPARSFLVNAGEEGSRVAVIEGEGRFARAQQTGACDPASRSRRVRRSLGGWWRRHRVEPKRRHASREGRLVHEGRGEDHGPLTPVRGRRTSPAGDERCYGRRAEFEEASIRRAIPTTCHRQARSSRRRCEQRLNVARPVVCTVSDAGHAHPDGLWICVSGPGSGDWSVRESRGAWTHATHSSRLCIRSPPRRRPARSRRARRRYVHDRGGCGARPQE